MAGERNLLRRGRPGTEIERITSRWYMPHRVSTFVLALALTWLAVFGIYVLTLGAAEAMSGGTLSAEFSDPKDYFFMFYGLGAILATMVTPLFGMEFLMDELEMRTKDKGLVAAFLGVRTVREGRKKVKSMKGDEVRPRGGVR